MKTSCYLCCKEELKVIRRRLRYGIKRNVLKCQNCGIIYLDPKPIPKDYYKKDYRKLYTPIIGKEMTAKQIFDIYLPAQKARIDDIKGILDIGMRVLDVGCSAGHFLYSLKPHVDECIGIEFNREEAEFASKTLGLKVYREPIEKTGIPPGHFDLITMFHVLEHIDDPIKFLKNIRKYIKPGGYLVVEVPNVDDALMSLYKIKEYSDFWFREPHIYYFSPRTLLMVMKKAGFEGKVKSLQAYNFINHMNWILTGKPQRSANIGMSEPNLIDSKDSPSARGLNDWIRKVDEEYKNTLNKYNVGDSIMFIGKIKK